jgi:hypothetical protein
MDVEHLPCPLEMEEVADLDSSLPRQLVDFEILGPTG